MAWTYHKPLVTRMRGGGTAWAGLGLLVVLWSEESTLAPSADDELLSALAPASNELVAVGYSRGTVEGSVLWSTPDDLLNSGACSWDAIESGHEGHAVSGATWCIKAGDGSNNAAQVLLASFLIADPEDYEVLTGGAFTAALPDDLFVSNGPDD